MNLKTIRRYRTDIHIISFGAELRMDSTIGVPGRREDIRKMYGSPRLNEVTALRMNLSFFNTQDPKSEEMGVGRGDCFVNVAYDGSRLHFEPDIPRTEVLWEAPAAYRLLRAGQCDYTGELPLKSITGSNPRTMVGQDAKGQIYCMISEGRRLTQKGLTANEQREVCKALGLVDAVNADGGGSSVAFLYDQQVGKAWDYRQHGRILVGYAKYTLKDLPVLRKGSKGVYVHLLQRLLGITADGIFGDMTEMAVIAYQAKQMIKQDGIVGLHTWYRLTKGVI